MLRKMICCMLVLVLALPVVLAENTEWMSAWKEVIALKTEPASYLALAPTKYAWSYLGEDGRILYDEALDSVSQFYNGISLIHKSNQYGYLREDGMLLVEPQYDGAGYFYDGLARVEENGKKGFIDESGAVVIPIIYDYANDFMGAYAAVGVRGASLGVQDMSSMEEYERNWGAIDRQGNIVLPLEYDEVTILEDGTIEATPKGEDEPVSFGIVNGKMQEITQVASSFSLDAYMPNAGKKVAELAESASVKWDDTANLPRLDGATALFPVYSAFVQATYPADTHCQEENENGEALVTCTKTNRAYERLVEGKADIIFCAGPSDAQVEAAAAAGVEFEMTPFGREAFVFIVNRENPLDEITVDEIRNVYSGKTTDWADLGVENLGEIIAYQRPENSGSQTTLEKLMGDVPLMTPPREEVIDFMDTVLETIEYRNFPNAIGYTFRFFCTDMAGSDVKLLAIDGVEPTVENIRSEAYPVTSTLYAVTRKGETNPNVRILLDWIASQQGAELIEKSGYVAA